MNIFDFIFKKSRKRTPELNASEHIKAKIISAISQSEEDIKTEQKKIEEIEKLAKELIADIYYVPSEFWYDELKYINEIKKNSKNKEIEVSVLEKTDNLLLEYNEQIKLCKSKIDLLNALLLKYEESLNKIETTIHKTLMLKSKSEYSKALKNYRSKLNEVLDKNENLSTIYEESEHFKVINEELTQIEEDFLIKKEVNDYINKITADFDENEENTDTEIIRDEINKIKKSLNTKKR